MKSVIKNSLLTSSIIGLGKKMKNILKKSPLVSAIVDLFVLIPLIVSISYFTTISLCPKTSSIQSQQSNSNIQYILKDVFLMPDEVFELEKELDDKYSDNDDVYPSHAISDGSPTFTA